MEVPEIGPIVFGGITATDNNGALIYDNDSTDWKVNENWNIKEEALFNIKRDNYCFSEEVIIIPPFTSSLRVISVYPNPNTGRFIIETFDSTNYSLLVRIVDRDYNVLESFDTTASYTQGTFFDLRDLNIINDTIRVYYKIIEEDCELKGHGNLLILEQ